MSQIGNQFAVSASLGEPGSEQHRVGRAVPTTVIEGSKQESRPEKN